eukprot:2044025-Amphidinium_carterae.1
MHSATTKPKTKEFPKQKRQNLRPGMRHAAQKAATTKVKGNFPEQSSQNAPANVQRVRTTYFTAVDRGTGRMRGRTSPSPLLCPFGRITRDSRIPHF